MSNWQPIDSLGYTSGERFLLWVPDEGAEFEWEGEAHVGYWEDNYKSYIVLCDCDAHYTPIKPTHWMPLPEPPHK